MDAAAYLSQLQALLPPGQAWPREPDAVLTRLLAGLAEGLARVDARAADLLEEADPRTALELLGEWEAMAGLPDACTGPAERVAARRRRVVAQLLMRGGQSRAYFIALAEALGFVGARITEHRPATCAGTCADRLYGEPWRYVWRLSVPVSAGVTVGTCAGGCDERLRSWGSPVLECVIGRMAPAHTRVMIGYRPDEDWMTSGGGFVDWGVLDGQADEQFEDWGVLD